MPIWSYRFDLQIHSWLVIIPSHIVSSYNVFGEYSGVLLQMINGKLWLLGRTRRRRRWDRLQPGIWGYETVGGLTKIFFSLAGAGRTQTSFKFVYLPIGWRVCRCFFFYKKKRGRHLIIEIIVSCKFNVRNNLKIQLYTWEIFGDLAVGLYTVRRVAEIDQLEKTFGKLRRHLAAVGLVTRGW